MHQDQRIRETEILALAIYFAMSESFDNKKTVDSVADKVIALLPVPVDSLSRTCAIARAKQRLGE